MSETEILIEFKDQVTSFCDELISQFPEEGDLVVFRLFFSNQLPIKSAMDSFNLQINQNDQQFRKMIKNRNEAFFLEHDVFEFVKDQNKVAHFRKIWRSGKLDEEDKDVIWKWFDAFVHLADKYTKVLNN